MSTGRRIVVHRTLEKMRAEELQFCQRRLEYLASRLQDLAVELGDGQGALWLKENMWFLAKPAKFIDDVLYGVGKVCNHLITYLQFQKQKIHNTFPFKSFIAILYEVADILAIVRDVVLLNPAEQFSCKQSQIDLFWTDCTPFLFIFEGSNDKFLKEDEVGDYFTCLLDVVPIVLQVGMALYCSTCARQRGFECFVQVCLRLSTSLVGETGLLDTVDQTQPVIVPFLRQWVLFALEVLQKGVKDRSSAESYTYLTPDMTRFVIDKSDKKQEETGAASQKESSRSSANEEVDDSDFSCLAPLLVFNSSTVRVTCNPSRWELAAKARILKCPNELRKHCLEEICLRENQKLVSDIYILTGTMPLTWCGMKVHCPLTKEYDEVNLTLFVKIRKGEQWFRKEATYQALYSKGEFLTFDGEDMDGFAAIEERPLVTRQIGPEGGHLVTDFDPRMKTTIPTGIIKEFQTVRMMIQPADKPRERQYRETCPGLFQCIKSTSNAVEINGIPHTTEKDVSIKIPFEVIGDAQTKILVLKYNQDEMEINDESVLRKTEDNCYALPTNDGGTVLATVDQANGNTYSNSDIRREMEILLGKKQLCKLLIFVEHQESVENMQCVFCIVCAEKYRIADVVREKAKSGLIELPKSQSPDRLLKSTDDVKLDLKGAIQLDEDIPVDAYNLTYLEGSDNYFRFPVTLTSTTGKITFVLRHCSSDGPVLHTFFYKIEDLLQLIVSGRHSKGSLSDLDDEVFTEYGIEDQETVIPPIEKLERPMSENPSQNRMSCSSGASHGESEVSEASSKDKDKEASLKILSRNSLVQLAKHLSSEEGHLLGVCLGMKPEKVGQIYRMYRHSCALATFYVLYEFRGRRAREELADRLVDGLSDIDREDLAQVVQEVRKKNKVLTANDFDSIQDKRKLRR